MGTPIVRLSASPDVPSATTDDLDALGAAAESQFGDSAVRYSHADWAKEQQAEPAYHAAVRYIALGRPPTLPDDFLSVFPFAPAPLLLGDPGACWQRPLHTTDDGTILLVRQPTPQPPPDQQRPVGRAACLLNDEPTRIYVPLPLHPR